MPYDYDTLLTVLQMHEAGVLSTRSAIEKLGFVEDANEEMARLADERAALQG